MSEQARHVIVLESHPYWEPELQRQFAGERVHVGASRSTKDLDQRLGEHACDVCVVDLSADVDGLLRWLGGRPDHSLTPDVIVIAGAAQASLEWQVRELGATAFAKESVTGTHLAAMCRKHWKSQQRISPDGTIE